MLAFTVGILVMAAATLFRSFQDSQSGGNRGQNGRERVFAVNVEQIQPQTIIPILDTYGEVVSGRTLELRAAAGGALVEMAPNFREGSRVAKGELLFQTDPATASANMKLAQTDLAEARAELQEAKDALILSRDELLAAQTQLDLRKQSVIRQESLRKRGVGTEAALETAKLAVSAAEQTILTKRQAIANANARINTAEIAIGRRQINLEEAQRKLNDTRVVASFDGVLSNVTGVLGGLVNANERLAELIDPTSLEVVFRISSDQFSDLTGATNGLETAKVKVRFTGSNTPIAASIERVSAVVGDGQTGRELYAKLSMQDASAVRPGDFVSVQIEEPPVENAALIPATAITGAGEVLLVGLDDRLQAATIPILRKQGDQVIVDVADIAGQRIVHKRAPQLGAGIKIEPREIGATLEPVTEKMVNISEDEQKLLIAAIEQDSTMPANVRSRIIDRVKSGSVQQENYDRIKSMIGEAAPAKEMVALSDEQRANMIAFVTTNSRIPQSRKAAMLETLAQPKIPKEMFDRLTLRMGG